MMLGRRLRTAAAAAAIGAATLMGGGAATWSPTAEAAAPSDLAG